MSDMLGYKGKRVIVTGCFSGMGHAAAKMLIEAGAEVHGVDYKECDLPLASFTNIDLRDRDSIEAGVESIGGTIHSLFSCAGLPGNAAFSALDVFTVNFIGHRHMTEQVIGRMTDGGSIISIASTAGMSWSQQIAKWMPLIQITDWDQARAWAKENEEAVSEGYATSKEALIIYTQYRAAELIKQGIRYNVTLPQPTQSPMMADFEAAASPDIVGVFAEPLGRYSTPEEQAGPLVLLNSDLAGIVNGVTLPVDGGFMGGLATGQVDLSKLGELMGG